MKTMDGVISPANGVLANDSDPDGGNLTAALATPPANGTVTISPDGSFEFHAVAGFTGHR